MVANDQARLAGSVALVLGGTGNVGEGIVRAFLEAGGTVAVPSRSERISRSFDRDSPQTCKTD